MKNWILTAAMVVSILTPVRADVTVVQTMTMEGAIAGMMPGVQMPRIVLRIKGMKSRSEIDVMGQSMIVITDLTTKQVTLLNTQTKTAQVISPQSVTAGGASLPSPAIDVTFQPSGKSQAIDGVTTDEHTFAMTLSMGEVAGQAQPGGGAAMPHEAAAMMQDVKMVMNGSVWIAKSAPGASEFAAFNKAALDADLFGMITGMKPGQSGGLDKLMAATASAPGIPYLTEISMVFEGTGPIVAAMKQMGAMKMVQKTSSVSTESIPDDLFKVPEGYTLEKK